MKPVAFPGGNANFIECIKILATKMQQRHPELKGRELCSSQACRAEEQTTQQGRESSICTLQGLAQQLSQQHIYKLAKSPAHQQPASLRSAARCFSSRWGGSCHQQQGLQSSHNCKGQGGLLVRHAHGRKRPN